MDEEDLIRLVTDDTGIRIIDLGDDGWELELQECIGRGYPGLGGDPEKGGVSDAPLGRILRTAINDLGARYVVIEPCLSFDWDEEYSKVYAVSFQPASRMVQRLHFFGPGENGVTLTAAALVDIPDELKKHYFGYTVLRPLQTSRVGNTVLKPAAVYSGVDGKTLECVHCRMRETTFLLNNRLKVWGMPFIQQESLIGVCAEADLWMMARYLHRRGWVRRYGPGEITQIALKARTTSTPREGLTASEMLAALVDMGTHPVLFASESPAQTKECIFAHVESEIPVIAVFDEHVGVVVGHSLPATLVIDAATVGMDQRPRVAWLSEAVDSFYVHDDEVGPYIEQKVRDEPEDEHENEKGRVLKLGGDAVEACITVLPRGVNLRWENLWSHVQVWLEQVARSLEAQYNIQMEDLVLRAFLRHSGVWKGELAAEGDGFRSEWTVNKYRCLPMPDFIWVVEIAQRNEVNGKAPGEAVIRGEMLFDSTANPGGFAESLIAFSYENVFYVRERGQHVEGRRWFPEWRGPYAPLMRQPM